MKIMKQAGKAIVILSLFAALTLGAFAGDGVTTTWRIGIWQTDSEFEQFLDFAKKHHLTGKISFFTCNCHTPPKLSDLLPTLEVVKRRIAVMKGLGYETGINHLVTLGHVDEGLDDYENIPEAQRFTGADGRHAIACYCPCDPIWRERYLKKVYQELAKTGADFIWTDDDIRLENHAVKGWGCFCPVCMKRLERIGYVGDRAGFGKWLEDPKEGDARRRAYLQFRRETVADLLGFIADTVREVNPAIPVGVMDCGSYDQLPGPEKFAALKGDRYPIYWRPGGGFWNDLEPDEILRKVNALARECAYIPDGIKCLEGEIESFNYQRLRKSVHFTRLESDIYVAACMPGVAYNVIGGPSTDDLSVAGKLVDALEANRARLNAIGAVTGRKPCRGVYPVFGRDSALGLWKGDGAAWLSIKYPHWTAPYHEGDIQKIGLPTAYRSEYASVWAADGRGVRSMTDAEIVTMLSTGAYLSYDAVEELVARGYGKDVGFDIVGDASGDEKYVEHPFNKGDVGRIRDVRQSFWGGTIRALKPHAGAETVSSVVSVTGDAITPCVSGCFENNRGGRVFVSGGFAWDRLLWKSKTDQLKRIFRWLSRETLPGYVESYHRVALWIRGGDAVVILNMSADPAQDVMLMLAGEPKTLETVGEKSSVKVTGKAAGSYSRYALPEISPWSVLVLKIQLATDKMSVAPGNVVKR